MENKILHFDGFCLEIIDNLSPAIGWRKRPTKSEWLTTKQAVEGYLGYEIVEWGAITNYKTQMFWVEIGDARTCKPAYPRLIELLDTN